MTVGRWLAALVLMCGVAAADERDAERALHAAQQRAASGDPLAIDALEAIGAERPVTRWTDDAWRSAAQLAERASDFPRARIALEQVVATSDDEQIIKRARADLLRLAGIAGTGGEWSAVAAQHEQLLQRARERGDPAPALRDLEALVRAHPGYPRAAMAMLALAHGWERDGEPERAIGWLREAERAATSATERTRATAELVRTLIRHGDLDEANAAIASIADPLLAARLRAALAHAELRRTIRWVVASVLFAIGVLAMVVLRRAAGSWRQVLRVLVRPPIEVWFFIPVAAVFAGVAQTGNQLVARAVIAVALAGTAVAWLSGVILEVTRDRMRRRAVIAHAAVAAVAVVAAIYLAIDRDRMIDLLIETWRGGPAMR
ncbi:MAG TPA: hypothetical protein VIV11_12905 [Kofleriaceae bacterium]